MSRHLPPRLNKRGRRTHLPQATEGKDDPLATQCREIVVGKYVNIRFAIHHEYPVVAFYPIIDHVRQRTSSYFLDRMSARDFAKSVAICGEAGSLPYTHLVIVSGAEIKITSADIVWLSASLKRAAGTHSIGHCAIVADSESDYGMLRMLATMVSDVCAMTAHHSYKEAILRLGWPDLLSDCSPADFSQSSVPGVPERRE